MADIKIREVDRGSIKALDRAKAMTSHIKDAGIKLKGSTGELTGTDERDETSYATDNTMKIGESSIEGAINRSGRVMAAGARKAFRAAGTERNRVGIRTKARLIAREKFIQNRVKASGEQVGKNVITTDFSSQKVAQAPHKPQHVKAYSTRRNKAEIHAAIGAKKRMIQSKKLEKARHLQQNARKAAERTAKKTRRAAVLILRAMRRIIEGMKALVFAIGAAGSAAIVIILVCTLFGAAFYFFGDDSSSNYEPVSPEVNAYASVIQEYATKYGIGEYTELIKAVMMQESGGRGRDPMQCSESPYNKKYPKKPGGIKDPEYSIDCGIHYLADCLKAAKVKNPLDMERIRLALQGYNYGNGYISWAIKRDGGYTVENAAVFSDEQAKKHDWKSYGDKQYASHVLRYYPYGSYNIGIGNGVIVEVAAKQIGNKGGKKFWSWYGFKNRVDWCAIFVSWCADQCGYIKNGTMPKFSIVSDGSNWFKKKHLWQKKSYKPSPGDIIFFDWDGNGNPNHVGIVEKCDGKRVYTIEGNTKDRCGRNIFFVNGAQIYGYGVPKY